MQRLTTYLRLFVWFSGRQLRRHPWRLAAVILGIALGAAVFTSVRLAVDASLDAFTQSMDLISGKADWSVLGRGTRVPEHLVARLKTDAAVETASPFISTYVEVHGKDRPPFLLIGIDPILDYPLRTWQEDVPDQEEAVLWLDLIRFPNTCLLTRTLAQSLRGSPGDLIQLSHVNAIAPFRILGILKPQGLARAEGGAMAITDIATIQEFMGCQGWVDRIDLKLKPWATEADLRRIQGVLPEAFGLERPLETKETGEAMIRGYQLNLSVLSLVSLFVGMFLVYSLVSLNAAARRNELAVLRALGGSTGLIFQLILSEGIALGIFGWIVAIPVGTMLVQYLLAAVSGTIDSLFVRVQAVTLRPDAWEILLSFGITVGTSLLAAFKPAWDATRIAPKEAMSMHGSGSHPPSRARVIFAVGLFLIALSWPLALLPPLGPFPLAGYLSAGLLIVGFSSLSPPLLRIMGSRLAGPLRRLGGEPAFLAGRYVREAGNRTAISVGALITAVALFVSLVIMVNSFRYTVSIWIEQTLAADYLLRPSMAGLNAYRDALPDEVVRAIEGMAPDVDILPYRRLHLRHNRLPYELEAVNLKKLMNYGGFILLQGRMEEIGDALFQGEGVLVSEVFSNRSGLSLGDRYRTQIGEVVLDLPILGVFRDYRTNGGAVYMDLKAYQSMTGDPAWGGVRFFFKNRERDLKAAIRALEERILRCCAQNHPLEMASGLELREEVLRIFDETFAVTTVLLFIALVVSALGIATTLTVLVLERFRQLNTLVAIGSSRGQIRAMVFWEAVLMVAAGEIIGLAAGLFLSAYLIHVINKQSFGWTFLYRIDMGTFLVSLPLILAAALAAALPAARLILRASPAQALKEA
ncbi:MAG: FtsX-like permease family protein [Candidatus Desulfacyla sp.]